MKKKVLLMGPQKSGKTSMRSMIFANYMPRDIERLLLTHEIDRSQVKFLGNLTLHLWDCGGQYQFIDEYLQKQRSAIFGNVAVLIYVMDIEALSKNLTENEWSKEKALQNFADSSAALKTFSPDARLFCLLHKIDLIPSDERETTVRQRTNEILQVGGGLDTSFFATSIMNTSLYDAWSTIVTSLIPKTDLLQRHLRDIAMRCDAEVAAIFDRTTFLCICRVTSDDAASKVTKVSVVIKAFKLAYAKEDAAFGCIELRDSEFVGIITGFTQHTLIMVISKDVDNVSPVVLRTNVQAASVVFQQYLSESPDATSMKEIL